VRRRDFFSVQHSVTAGGCQIKESHGVRMAVLEEEADLEGT
jgi:hypothetical protein